VALGGSWTVYLWRVFGSDAVRGHYLGEIATRSMTGFDPLAVVTAYPLILLTDYQPLAIPGLIGAFVLFRDAWRDRHPGRMLLVVWIGLPLVLYGFGGARSVRYIFPILPPLALAAGYWLAQVAPSVALALRRYAVPAVALTVAVVFWVVPSWLTRDLNAVFKARASVFQESLADDERLVYVGDRYWEVANPLLYYASRELEPPARDLDEAVALARRSRAKLLLIDRERHEQLDPSGVEYETRLEGPRWLLVSVLAEP
jgi:hypothetical protein